MRKTAMIATAVMLALASGQALAHEDRPMNVSEQQGQAISVAAMKQKISDLGYDVQRIKVDDGVIKALLVEREFGGAVKATFSAQGGELIKARLAH